MKVGRMIHIIEIQRPAVTVNDAGTPESTWSHVATLRAELVERSTEEFLRSAGETILVFRTRFLAGFTDEDRVSFDGGAYDIDKIVTIGRRRGLELRCRRVTS